MNGQPANVELFWEQILEYVEEGLVVPVVGQDLLQLSLDGREVAFYTLLAERLAARLKLPADDSDAAGGSGALDAVAYRYLAAGGNVQFLYSALKSVTPAPQELPVPQALDRLARIEKLSLFISTTFDSLLEHALNVARFGGQPLTKVFSYTPSAADPGSLGEMEGPVVLHLFGKLSSLASEYALTEEDRLEFVHSLQSETRRPRVLDELAERPLLVLGTGFPDWLARFFLRLGSGARLSARRGKTDVFADRTAGSDPGLDVFLRHFGPGIQVFPEGAIAFVDELSRRWGALHPERGEAAETPPAQQQQRFDLKPGAIFLSYASEDLAAARTLRDALAGRGMAVWFDKEALQAGDAFALKIRRAIQGSCLFVPVVSRHSLTAQGRFFRREWVEAEDFLAELPPNRPFILPVAIDDTSAGEEALPEAFRRVHWTRLPQGQADSAFLDRLQDLYRKYQQSGQAPR